MNGAEKSSSVFNSSTCVVRRGLNFVFFFPFFLDVQIEFEGIKYTPVEDDNEVRNDDDDKVQEQHEQDEAELS